MNTTIDYLDAVKIRHGVVSDYALAKILGISQPTISNYRVKLSPMDDKVCIRVAELLKIEPAAVLASVHIDRAKSEDEKKVWKSIYDRVGGIAASVAIATLLFSAYPASSKASDLMVGNNVYYVK
ncbi:MAG TPA: DUF3693 domain-containing protein [Methylophilaceae bacterium]